MVVHSYLCFQQHYPFFLIHFLGLEGIFAVSKPPSEFVSHFQLSVKTLLICGTRRSQETMDMPPKSYALDDDGEGASVMNVQSHTFKLDNFLIFGNF